LSSGKDGSKVPEKGSVNITVIVVSKQSQLFFSSEVAFFLCACLHKFLQHFTDVPVWKRKAADEQLCCEEQQ
jgi:hypothetical protein